MTLPRFGLIVTAIILLITTSFAADSSTTTPIVVSVIPAEGHAAEDVFVDVTFDTALDPELVTEERPL